MTVHTEVDGVPTLVAPASGPMRAGLMFRVGRADETLARGGATHLVEHLAVHHQGLADYHFNGATGASVTHFHVQGGPDDVVAFLAGVTAALRDLPLDRLEVERDIVRTEWASRTPVATEAMPAWRYGARGYGLVSYPEWGLSMLTADDLLQWTARYFTRDNAVLWIAGDGVPAGLRLALPDGAWQPPPEPAPALPHLPTYFAGGSSTVAVDAVVRRRPAAPIAAELLQRELFRALRKDSGLSYTTAAGYEPDNAELATVTALADALPAAQDAVLGGFIDALAALRVGRIGEAALAAAVDQALAGLAEAEEHGAHVLTGAFDRLMGRPAESLDEIRSQLRALTREDVQAVVCELWDSALLMVPAGGTADWAGVPPAPARSTTAVAGPRYRSYDGSGVALVVGAEGASLTDGTNHATVRYDQVAAMLAWPDGGRQLVGTDGIGVGAEPTLYRLDAAALRRLDEAVPATAQVRMPAREPAEIPKPVPVPRVPLARRAGARVGRGLLRAARYVAGGLAWLAALVGIVVGGIALGLPGPLIVAGGIAWAAALGGYHRARWTVG